MKCFKQVQRVHLLCASTILIAVGGVTAVPLRAQNPDNSISIPDEANPKAKKGDERPTVKLKIQVRGSNDKPVADASVYVRYNVPGGLIHKDKLAELDLKTSGDGSVKVPAIPRGKILVQVIAPGWHTYGKWYDIEDKDEESIEIKLDQPHRWY